MCVCIFQPLNYHFIYNNFKSCPTEDCLTQTKRVCEP